MSQYIHKPTYSIHTYAIHPPMPMSSYAPSIMSSPCHTQPMPMPSTPIGKPSHAIPCHPHGTPISSRCYPHAILMLSPCHAHVMPWHPHVTPMTCTMPMNFTCTARLIDVDASLPFTRMSFLVVSRFQRAHFET
jgi:hypothetical protein